MVLGVDHPDFMDVQIPDEDQDPVNFDVAMGLAEQANGLRLGQTNANGGVAQANADGQAEVPNGDIHNHGDEVVGAQEEYFQVSFVGPRMYCRRGG